MATEHEGFDVQGPDARKKLDNMVTEDSRRSTELFLESRVLDPLRRLRTVETLGFDFEPLWSLRFPDGGCDLSWGFVRLLQVLKDDIEANDKRNRKQVYEKAWSALGGFMKL